MDVGGTGSKRRTVFELSSTTKTDPFYERIVDKRDGIGGKKGGGVFLLDQERESKEERRKKSRLDSRRDTEWTR